MTDWPVHPTTHGYVVDVTGDEQVWVTRCKTTSELYCHACRLGQKLGCEHIRRVQQTKGLPNGG